MTVCVDASAVVPWVLPLPSSPAVDRFWADVLRRRARLTAPPLILAEATSVLRRYVHIGGIVHEEAAAALRQLLELPLSIVDDPEMYLRALELARRLDQPKAYDVQYLAVAAMEDCAVLTLDRRLCESARSLGIAARLLA